MQFNKVILGGNLTRDPEMRYTPKGVAIAKFSIAINRKWKNESGEVKEEVTFVECDAFSKMAETLAQYFKKGNPILIEGRLRLNEWEDKGNNKRQKLTVVVEGFSFVGTKTDGSGSSGGGEGRQETQRQSSSKPKDEASQPPPADDSDDVPFLSILDPAKAFLLKCYHEALYKMSKTQTAFRFLFSQNDERRPARNLQVMP